MSRWTMVVAMVAMLLLGLAAGSVLTGTATAEETCKCGRGRFQVVPLQRIDKDDPLAIRIDTQGGSYDVIRR